MTSRSITQVLVKGSRYPSHLDVTVLDHHESFEWEETITSKLLTHPNADILNWPYIGFSVLQSAMESGGMYLALATYERAIVIKTTANELGKMGHDENWKALYNLLSGGSSFSYIDPDEPSKINTQEPTLVAFDLVQHTLTMHVASKAELSHIVGVDLECLYPEARASLPSTIIRKTFGDGVLHGSAYEVLWRKPDLENRSDTIKELLEGDAVALRAWMAVLSAEMKGTIVQSATKIDTRNLPRDDLDLLAQVQQQFDLLEGSKPERSVNEFSSVEPGKTDREFIINNTAFKNKNRAGTAQTVILRTRDGQVIEARIKKNQGKRAIAYIPETTELPSVDLESITSVETIGLEDLTTASISRIIYMLGILQGTDTLSASPFIRKIWRPTDEDKAELAAIKEQQNMPITEEDGDAGKWENLNSSQAAVAKAMLSDGDFALVHGPPGTGKTRTIAFVAKQWVNEGKKAFLVAQSNVGVKNIAETLAKDNSLNFKLLVSTQFYDEWHEDIYEGCRENMIQSGEFKEALKAGIMNTPLILCTVNMLFNKQVDKQVFNAIPLERLVVDEASQIFIGDYLALFHKFRGTLKKVCWFGDPKQLPPHQGEQIEGLTSVYDIPHIEQNSLLLDTQYRMPDKIGDFISKAFYGAKLKSHKKVEGYECMRFVDVSTGHEQLKGTSWINKKEAMTVATLVQNYYQGLPFCIITPYDSQRKEIEEALKNRGLPSSGVCYNVDSFQGNEKDYVIISTVRTDKPGFLNLMNRVNVMLTRCKEGMVIVSNRYFIRHEARMTMVGQLADMWSKLAKEDNTWVDYLDVHHKYADMPGSPGIPRPKPPSPPPVVQYQSPSGFFGIAKSSNVPAPKWGPSATKATPKSPPGLVPSAPVGPSTVQRPKIAGAWTKVQTISGLPSRDQGSSQQSPSSSSSASSGSSKKLVLNNSTGLGRPSQPKKNAWGPK